MIAKLWEEIFRIGDKYKKMEHKALSEFDKKLWKEREKAVTELDNAFQKIWDNGEKYKKELTEVSADNLIDELTLSITGLEVYEDSQDGQIFFELEGRHFDNEKEILSHVVDLYNHGRGRRDSHWKKEKDGKFTKITWNEALKRTEKEPAPKKPYPVGKPAVKKKAVDLAKETVKKPATTKKATTKSVEKAGETTKKPLAKPPAKKPPTAKSTTETLEKSPAKKTVAKKPTAKKTTAKKTAS